MGSHEKRIAVLLLTDKSTDEISELYSSLKESLDSIATVFVLYHQKGKQIPDLVKRLNHYVFDNRVLTDLHYVPIAKTLVPGSNHFPLLQFYSENNTYEYYCIVEDDVRFTGDWKSLFQMLFDFKPDLLSCCLRHWREEPSWYWWNTLKFGESSQKSESLLALFNPIYGMSNRALSYIDRCLSLGWRGHHEVLLPSLLNAGGYKLVDFGGDGDYVPKGYENRFYYSVYTNTIKECSPTMLYRPAMKQVGVLENKLYHPVKNFEE